MDGGAEACGSVVRPTLTGSTLQHSPHHRAHKIFHLLRATAPTPAAVLLLPSGRARRPCAASLAPAGGGDGEAEEPWKSMETTRRIIKQSAVDVLGELVFRRVISSHLTTTCVGSVVVDKKKKKKKNTPY